MGIKKPPAVGGLINGILITYLHNTPLILLNNNVNCDTYVNSIVHCLVCITNIQILNT